MKRKITILSPAMLASGVLLMASSCSTATNGDNPDMRDTVRLDPVEQNEGNADYQPAFPGQTRIGGVKTSTPYEVEVVTKDLANPWGITAMPDGRLLITEKKGTMRILQDSTLSEAITGIPEVDSRGQGGLLGLTLDPDFSSNRMVYWVFSHPTGGGNLTAVAKGRLADDEKTIENASIVYQATPAYDGTLHYGGRILVDKAGNLVVSTGERSDLETRPQAQDLKSGLGKIIRITKDGQPAEDNPFLNNAEARPEIYSYGHRNVQGLAFHPVTGDLWETEFGPRGGDEVNRVEAGKNYGWPTITYGIEYNGNKVGDSIQQKSGLEQPVYYYDPVISPSGITFYSGDAIPEWRNNLFISALSGVHVARLVIEDNKVTGEERLLVDQGQRIRDITQGKDGALYAISDSGWVFRIGKAKEE